MGDFPSEEAGSTSLVFYDQHLPPFTDVCLFLQSFTRFFDTHICILVFCSCYVIMKYKSFFLSFCMLVAWDMLVVSNVVACHAHHFTELLVWCSSAPSKQELHCRSPLRAPTFGHKGLSLQGYIPAIGSTSGWSIRLAFTVAFTFQKTNYRTYTIGEARIRAFGRGK